MTRFRRPIAKTYDRFLTRKSLLPDGLSSLVKRNGAKKILEFGSGTGTVAVGLSLEGYDVTAVDYSPEMLKIARKKAKALGAGTRFVNGNIIDIELPGRFDLLLCLGNTLPLITPLSDYRRFLRNCARHLGPGGTFILQILNYDRILKHRPATFATEALDDLIRVKQYRYGRSLIEFTVSLIDTTTIPPKITVTKNKIRPWRKNDLAAELRMAGFAGIEALGSYSNERFTLKSKDLVIAARKAPKKR